MKCQGLETVSVMAEWGATLPAVVGAFLKTKKNYSMKNNSASFPHKQNRYRTTTTSHSVVTTRFPILDVSPTGRCYEAHKPNRCSEGTPWLQDPECTRLSHQSPWLKSVSSSLGIVVRYSARWKVYFGLGESFLLIGSWNYRVWENLDDSSDMVW